RQDVWVVFQIVLDNSHNNRCVVLVAFREERADWTVDQTRNQRFVFRRTTFAREVAAWNLTCSRCLFLIVYSQREEVLTWLRSLSRYNSRENHCFTVSGDNCAVSLTSNFARFELQRAACPFDFNRVLIKHVLSLQNPTGCADAQNLQI